MAMELKENRLCKDHGAKDLPGILNEVTASMGIMLKHIALDEMQGAELSNTKQVIDYLFCRIQDNAVPLVASRIISDYGYDPRTRLSA